MNKIMTLCHGNTYNLTYSVKNLGDGLAKDLTGTQELKFALAKNSSASPLLELVWGVDAELTIASPNTLGEVTVVISSENLNVLAEGRYYFEIWHKDSSGDPTTLVSQPLSISNKLIID